jgi:hypothetical protein
MLFDRSGPSNPGADFNVNLLGGGGEVHLIQSGATATNMGTLADLFCGRRTMRVREPSASYLVIVGDGLDR